MEPAGIAPSNAGLQQRKSSDTRIAILEAAIDCLATHGYAHTTTQLIAKKAKLSRGAMLHHYATRQDLIESVIDYAFYRHMENLVAGIRSLSVSERTEDNAGIMIDWDAYLSREHLAYLELTIAARTDKALRTMFLPRARRFDELWHNEMLQAFPEWGDRPELFERVRKFVRAVMSGLILNREIWDNNDGDRAALGFLSYVVAMVRDGELPFPAAKIQRSDR